MKSRSQIKQHLNLLSESGLFDVQWYLERYPEVEQLRMHPIKHYLQYGARVGFDPSPRFSSGYYLQANQDVASHGVNPLVHYVLHGRTEGRAPIGRVTTKLTKRCDGPAVQGAFNNVAGVSFGKLEVNLTKGKKPRSAQPCVMVCGHVAGNNLYGGERSFIDLIEGFDKAGFAVLSTIPKSTNYAYMDLLAEHSIAVVSFPYGWWRRGVGVSEDVVTVFEQIIRECEVDAVHVNTIMLREPLVAARNRRVPSTVHVREILRHDQHLCDFIGQDFQAILKQLRSSADYFVANSKLTSHELGAPNRTFVIPNTVDFEKYTPSPRTKGDSSVLLVGMISSNIPKKGISEFVAIAKLLEHEKSIRFLLIGPISPQVQELMGQDNSKCPTNLILPGYFTNSDLAFDELDIVLNLSTFQESFGRTVLEAMACGVPVIAYDWGALGELIEDGKTGYLVPFRSVEAVAERIANLASDPNLRDAIGHRARTIAIGRYAMDLYSKKIREVYEKLLSGKSPPKPKNLPSEVRVTVVVPNYNYDVFIRDRIRSILDQTVLPYEVILLDDCSNDDSDLVAAKMLEDSGIRFRFFPNERNRGTYGQWWAGIEAADGDYIWIAEADDISEPDFLENLLQPLGNPRVAMAYCQSRVIDENGAVTRARNFHHTEALDSRHWLEDYVQPGTREVVDYLAYRNTIPNVSACVFRANELKLAAEGIARYQFCGDWALYCRLIRKADIAFVADPLNYFRRHSQSVTRSRGKSEAYLMELLQVQQEIIETYPIQRSQLQRMQQFLDNDYKISGIERNSEHPEAKSLYQSLTEKIGYRRKFALVTTNNGSYNGGSEMLWIETAERLADEGHDVMCLIKKWEPEPSFLTRFRARGICAFFKSSRDIEVLEDFGPDLVVISTGDQDEGTEYFGPLADRKIPYIIVNQLTKQVEYWPLREKRTPEVVRGYANAKQVFFTCWNNHRVMERRLEATIDNASLHFNPYHIDRSIVPPWPSSDGKFRLAVPAKMLHIHKGQKLIIDLMSQKKWRERPLKISFFGEGPDEKEFRNLVEKASIQNIKFFPRVPLESIWENHHGILMASFMEGLPIVLVSAMLSARVPILTDIGGHAEVVEDSVNGFIARLPSVSDIDEALERAYTQRDSWQNIGLLAREAILEFLPEDPVANFVGKVLGYTQSIEAPAGRKIAS